MNTPAPTTGVDYRGRIGTGDMLTEEMKSLIRGLPEGSKDEIVCGTIFGKAHGISARKSTFNDDVPAIALIGIFEFLPADPRRAPLRSGTLFLPSALQAHVVAAVNKGKPLPMVPKRGASIDAVGETVSIEAEVSARKSTGAVGYEFLTKSAREVSITDELAEMRNTLTYKGERPLPALPKPQAAALTDQSKGKRRRKAK